MAESTLEADRNQDFVQLFTRHARQIYSYILTLAGNTDEADEIFQDTNLVLWEKFAEFETGTNFRAWACRVAYYRTLNHNSRKQRAPLAFSDMFLSQVDAEAMALADSLDEQHRALAECYSRLSRKERDLVDRRYRRGQKTAQIAEQLKRPALAVYRALAKVHERLFDCVTETLQQ